MEEFRVRNRRTCRNAGIKCCRGHICRCATRFTTRGSAVCQAWRRGADTAGVRRGLGEPSFFSGMARQFRLLLHLGVGCITRLGRQGPKVSAGVPASQERSSICNDGNGAAVVYPAQKPILRPAQICFVFFRDSHYSSRSGEYAKPPFPCRVPCPPSLPAGAPAGAEDSAVSSPRWSRPIQPPSVHHTRCLRPFADGKWKPAAACAVAASRMRKGLSWHAAAKRTSSLPN